MEAAATIANASKTISQAFQWLLLVAFFLRKRLKRDPLAVEREISVFISRLWLFFCSESVRLSAVSNFVSSKSVHSFCEGLLSSFGLEEAVSPRGEPRFRAVGAIAWILLEDQVYLLRSCIISLAYTLILTPLTTHSIYKV